MTVELHLGDCLEVMRTLDAGSIDSIVCDPPYGLSFMGKGWDHGVPGVPFWEAALRVAKPGAHLLAFGGDRTHHRLMVAIEDAGWEIRTCLYWIFGSGFPKSHDISKAIDKHGGQAVGWFGPWLRQWREENGITQKQIAALFPSVNGGLTGCVANWELGFNMPTPEQFNTICQTFGLPFASLEEAEREVIGRKRSGIADGPFRSVEESQKHIDITAPATDAAKQWRGWGTALKPAAEIIVMAMKPLDGTFANNALVHGVAGLNVDACRIGTSLDVPASVSKKTLANCYGKYAESGETIGVGGFDPNLGRWPANVLLDEEAAAMLDEMSGERKSGGGNKRQKKPSGFNASLGRDEAIYGPSMGGDTGGASRFYYVAKASKRDRNEGLEGMSERVELIGAAGHKMNPMTGKPVVDLPRKNGHPTVKPTALMRWLVRLVTRPNGVILDPFMGSGSTDKAAKMEGFGFVGIELDPTYFAIAQKRIEQAAMQPSLFEAMTRTCQEAEAERQAMTLFALDELETA